MDAQSNTKASSTGEDGAVAQQRGASARRASSSQDSHTSEDSHTALDFLRSQMQLEADAREALPFSIEHCTKPLGRLRQSVFACLTCNPPPADPAEPYTHPAGVCYACSVQCHGEHTLVELFNKRNFVCDCGTTRFETTPCALRTNPTTRTKGGVSGEAPDPNNRYNQNFRNRFCGCACDYDPFQQKGTMFQCLGLGTHETGGCGEDWWHPGCVVGLGPKWSEEQDKGVKAEKSAGEPKASAADALPTISEDAETTTAAAAPLNANEDENAEDDEDDEDDEDEPPLPPGFPKEDDFEGFICYKCVEAYPWIKQYAGAPGFLPAVFCKQQSSGGGESPGADAAPSRKRKVDDTEADGSSGQGGKDDDTAATDGPDAKRRRDNGDTTETTAATGDDGTTKQEPAAADGPRPCKRAALPPAPAGRFSLFFRESFRDQLCRCADCFPLLAPHAQLLEEEETYEPPVSEEGSEEGGGHGGSAAGGGGGGGGSGPSHGSGSLYERGESALRNVDRVRAIEGVMAYNHLKDKLKPFFQQFAESGQAISAEDIKAYFAQLRGDEQAIREAGEAARLADGRRDQEGY